MRVWGFDLGSTSIGWAIVGINADNTSGSIVATGVRIFPDAVLKQQSAMVTRNSQRRAARLLRRQVRRRRLRRKAIGDLLTEAGLLPRFGSAQWHELMNCDPYTLRADGLSRQLTPYETGRALYHLLKRRGFQSARVAERERLDIESEVEKEEGKVKSAIEELAREMAGRTLAETLKDEARKRGRYVGRAMVRTEFDRLWAAQASHHKAMTPALRENLADAAFTQRPIFWRLGTLGTCELEPGAPLATKSSWIGQQFVMLQTLNSLRLAGGNGRELTEEERTVLRAALMCRPSLTFPAIRRLLKATWQENGTPLQSRFNFEVGDARKSIPGNAMEARLYEVFGDAWLAHPAADRIRTESDEALRRIHYERIGNRRIEIVQAEALPDRKAQFVNETQAAWGITRIEAEALSEGKPGPGWLRHSERAITRLLPHLETGRHYSDALDAEYPDRARVDVIRRDHLSSRPDAIPDVRNPTVTRALNELRKIVNNLLDAHGRPDLIRLELAREARLPPKIRQETATKMRRREAERKKAVEVLKACGLASPSGHDIEKYLLWKECGERCPYTGISIGFGDLFGPDPKFETEHIFPRSMTLDNGFGNKTLCHIDFNKRKGNRSPWEAFGHTTEWETIEQALRASALPNNNPAKARRFLATDYADIDKALLGETTSQDRILRDSSYVARRARAFLAQLFEEERAIDRVETVNGRITSALGRRWGVHAALGDTPAKDRSDHRHHAADAIVIALTTRAHVKHLSEWYRDRRDGRISPRIELPPPWEGFFEEARSSLAGIIVSHRTQRKVSGPLHEQSHWGQTRLHEREGGTEYDLVVQRKPLANMSPKELENIADRHIRRLAAERLAAHGGDRKKAFATPLALTDPATGEVKAEVVKARYHARRQIDLMVPVRPIPKTYVDAGLTHHVAIRRNQRNGEIRAEIVSLHEAARRQKAGLPVVDRARDGDETFVMSLAAGDTIALPENGECAYWRVDGVWSNGPIVILRAEDARPSSDRESSVFRPNAKSLIERGAVKVAVDPIGRVRAAGD